MSPPAAEKVCRSCGEVKPLNQFYTASRGGLKSHCKACADARRAAWDAANVDARRRIARRARLKTRYGIDDVQYDALLAHQGGGCAICGLEWAPDEASLPVDHDAATGVVRGLLCHSCNLGIGHLQHDPQLLAAAIAYLGDPPAGYVSCPPRVPYSRDQRKGA